VSCRVGLIWDCCQTFNRFIEDCGAVCEAVTPHLLAAPFYRGRYNALIVPTGFANPAYSRCLPGLRAATPRICRFVEAGGRLLVYGAAAPDPTAYDWLPVQVKYEHGYGLRRLTLADHPYAAIIEGYDAACVPCDGSFPEPGGDVVAVDECGKAVLVAFRVGRGKVAVTSIHEYPSRRFVGLFACGEEETLL